MQKFQTVELKFSKFPANCILPTAILQKLTALLFLFLHLAGPLQLPVMAQEKVTVGAFSESVPGAVPSSQWMPLHFTTGGRPTDYRLVSDNGSTVLEAKSHGSASMLIRRITIDSTLFPIITWRWKITGIINRGDARKKKGDDYPARLYILFAGKRESGSIWNHFARRKIKTIFGDVPPGNAINYIWANHTPAGTMLPSPYTRRFMMFALENGSSWSNIWRQERRDISRDYRRAFGSPPPSIVAVGLMTDTDNTEETAISYYGDIVFRHR